MNDGDAPSPAQRTRRETLVREILERVADQWTLLVVDALHEGGTLRFSELKERVGGVSQKMLTRTLRLLERDGLVTRVAHAVMPPRVDYRLTPLGESLDEALCGVWRWVEAHIDDVDQARRGFAERASGPEAPDPGNPHI